MQAVGNSAVVSIQLLEDSTIHIYAVLYYTPSRGSSSGLCIVNQTLKQPLGEAYKHSDYFEVEQPGKKKNQKSADSGILKAGHVFPQALDSVCMYIYTAECVPLERRHDSSYSLHGYTVGET